MEKDKSCSSTETRQRSQSTKKLPSHLSTMHPLKLYERMIIARMSLTVEENLTPDQAGFRPGRSTCGQLLNHTQYIEDGFEEKQITGTVFVDLTAAYDTVNHKILLLKVAKMIKNKKIVSNIQTLLENRRFFVEMDGRKSRSCHAKKVDAELNNACRIVTGQLRPTPLPLLFRTAGIAQLDIRSQTHGSTEKHKQETDLRHPLFDHSYPRVRLKSRKSFRTVESVQPDQAVSHRLELWDNTTNEAIRPPKEQLPPGRELQRKDWVNLNRARAKVGMTASTLHKWKLKPNSECSCGNQNQTMDHILSECTEGPHCTDQDLRDCTDAVQAWITHWRDKI
ncbi:RNA-directed DNA polymerase from mobile element jockey [Elysia marginata]|uniref:RNA-directed DNA polymerase from mobile element jockey n=1 Tax=Elysia marginata TaxID=1093978 RepID=A0AAV4GLR7_9GAST|nr:RNA-directed DNA polymerase from mobile element jockey [Elysia marginata]